MAKKTTDSKSSSRPVPQDLQVDSIDEKAIIITKDGYDKLLQELEYLKSVKRREVAGRLQEAISYGDLSENSEYEDAKNEQAFVEGRVLELEDKVKHAKIIDENQKRTASVQLGSTVWIRQIGKQTLHEYVIVGSTEADPMKRRISNISPVGTAVLDKNVGDHVKVHAPSGVIEYEIAKVE